MKCLQIMVLALVTIAVAWVPARPNRGVVRINNGPAVVGTRKILGLQVKGVHSAYYDGLRMSDEEEDVEEEEEEEEEVPTPNPIIEDVPDISPFKEGIKFPTSLNGSDVRVGIIMARWNADVINGLYTGVNESLLGTCITPELAPKHILTHHLLPLPLAHHTQHVVSNRQTYLRLTCPEPLSCPSQRACWPCQSASMSLFA